MHGSAPLALHLFHILLEVLAFLGVHVLADARHGPQRRAIPFSAPARSARCPGSSRTGILPGDPTRFRALAGRSSGAATTRSTSIPYTSGWKVKILRISRPPVVVAVRVSEPGPLPRPGRWSGRPGRPRCPGSGRRPRKRPRRARPPGISSGTRLTGPPSQCLCSSPSHLVMRPPRVEISSSIEWRPDRHRLSPDARAQRPGPRPPSGGAVVLRRCDLSLGSAPVATGLARSG